MPQPDETKPSKKIPPPGPAAPRPPQQSQLDQERSDWEGMGQAPEGSDEPQPSTPEPTQR